MVSFSCYYTAGMDWTSKKILSLFTDLNNRVTTLGRSFYHKNMVIKYFLTNEVFLRLPTTVSGKPSICALFSTLRVAELNPLKHHSTK